MKPYAVLVCLLSVGVSGCMVPQPPAADPKPQPQATRKIAPWWEVFKDPLMNHLATQMLDQNLDLKLAKARIEEARALHYIAQSNLLPDLSLQGTATRGNTAIGTLRPQGFMQLGFDATWEADLFGTNQASLSAQSARLQGALFNAVDVKRVVVAELIRNVIVWRQAHQTLCQTQQILTLRGQQIALLQARFQAGLMDARTLTQAQAQRQQTASSLELRKAAVIQTQYSLENLMGMKPESLTSLLSASKNAKLSIPHPKVAFAIPLQAIRRRPDVQVAGAALLAAKAEVQKAEADLWPKLNLGAFFGARDTTSGLGLVTAPNPIWSLSSGLLMPLLNFGRLKQAVKTADARCQQAAIIYKKTVLSALQEAHTALSDYVKAINALAQQQAALKQLQKNVDLAQERHARGLTDRLAVLAAELVREESMLDLIQRQQASALAYVRLKKAL